ncbi:MAG: ribosome maturation factor RimP [Gammaproteobacteria bacterium]|nr:MAG: ribosome maturation factor RimP [Gammaproteobacteria bacterium]
MFCIPGTEILTPGRRPALAGERLRHGNESLQALLTPVVEGLGYEFVGLELIPQPRASLLRIYIDHERGITLDDCERVSHQVEGVLDVEDPIRGHYLLEVSSPGLDRLLFTREQCLRFLGEQVRVELGSPHQGRRRWQGRLVDVDENGLLRLEAEDEAVSLPFEEIDRIRLIPQWD